MSYINANIQWIEGYVHRKFATHWEPEPDSQPEDYWLPCVIFGICCRKGYGISFHILLECGAQIARVPIWALNTQGQEFYSLTNFLKTKFQMWDCPSSNFCVHEFDFLAGCQVVINSPCGRNRSGEYLFTIDYEGENADSVGDIGHKNAHIIETNDGHLIAMPNDRICWHERSFVDKPFDWNDPPKIKRNRSLWTVGG